MHLRVFNASGPHSGVEMATVFIVIILIIIAGLWVLYYLANRQRKRELAALSASWGFSWNDYDPLGIDTAYQGFAAVNRGHDRYAYNVFYGDRSGRNTICFDYHYRTGSGKSESTHYFSGALVCHGYPFPYLLVRPEGIFDKLAEFVGLDDIDFESAEFSRTFYVKSNNKKFAYDFFHARAMEYMLSHDRHFSMEFKGDTLLITDDRTWSAKEYEAAVLQVEGLLDLMPEFLRRGLKEGTL